MICLDTNAVIAVLNDRTSPVRRRVEATIKLGQAFSISSIVLVAFYRINAFDFMEQLPPNYA